jgi:arabinofuranosyltransferase
VTQRGAEGRTALGRGEIFVLLVASVVLVVGWRVFWFLTDDAYIAFRYVSNRMLGYGFVWNAPPFLPVEGYTSFAWIVILEGIWRVFGVEPPRSANVVSLLFTLGTLALTWSLIRRPLDILPPRARVAIVAGLAGFLVTNRTFLTWASSGLETALFVFLLVLWVRQLLFSKSRGRIASASLVAAALELTRPDGLLFCAATFLVAASEAARDRETARLRWLVECAPLLLVGVHELWRFTTYGTWLPNTYHAKYVAPWPEAGLRYLYCFVVENGLWVPLGFLAFALLRRGRRVATRADDAPPATDGPPRAAT